MTPSLIGRRTFLAAAARSTAAQRQLASTSLRAASTIVASQQSTHSSSSTDQSKYGLLAAAAGATLLASGALTERDTSAAKCCGIAGVVGAKGDARDYLIEGLTILKNRGYDSAGIATMDENNPTLVSLLFVCIDVKYCRPAFDCC